MEGEVMSTDSGFEYVPSDYKEYAETEWEQSQREFLDKYNKFIEQQKQKRRPTR